MRRALPGPGEIGIFNRSHYANRKWYRNWAVGRLLVETLREMDPRSPDPELDIPALRTRLAEGLSRSRTAS